MNTSPPWPLCQQVISHPRKRRRRRRREQGREWPLWAGVLFLLGSIEVLGVVVGVAEAMTPERKKELREEARTNFRHGWDNYMRIAFPEDEIKPISCTPHHRDRSDPTNIGLNDAMGDFSLTAVDTLSSLALMAASSEEDAKRFWETAEEIIRIYWYNRPKGCTDDDEECEGETSSWGHFQNRGRGSQGFDIDAKVQVFETTIRAVGGLLSAHLFATSDLPSLPASIPSGFIYKNELLHLAHDLGTRLLPALTESPTGLPYPRINLRHGLPHKSKNPTYYRTPRKPPFPHPDPWTTPEGDQHSEHNSERTWKRPVGKIKPESPQHEITETCTAGAGSLVLEFTTLSRLTGDARFEIAAKRAFDAVWSRRSAVGLLGGGIDAESGLWVGGVSGIGAGADSFFEYAFKSYVLLAGVGRETDQRGDRYFLKVWEESRAAIERHMKVETPTTWWENVHLGTGAVVYGASNWVDSLGAFWPGVLSGSGSANGSSGDGLEEGVKGNLFYTALWTRYSALPERYNTRLATIESGLSWYPGRPEFIESTYFLYRATKDPWYLHVGEMVMRDLKRRCKSRCGWAGLQDVRSGEKQDRMESFWLGETWTYLFLLFDEDHPLHKGDDPWVFTTEGHPLIIPKRKTVNTPIIITSESTPQTTIHLVTPRTCTNPHLNTSTGSFFSPTASRPDIFHAAFFTRLHLLPKSPQLESALEPSDLALYAENSFWSPTNSTFYPWTLPRHVISPGAVCAPLPGMDGFELMFPVPDGSSTDVGNTIKRVSGGVLVSAIEGLRLGLVRDTISTADGTTEVLRIHRVGPVSLGREEKVFMDRAMVGPIQDPNFGVVSDEVMVDLVIDLEPEAEAEGKEEEEGTKPLKQRRTTTMSDDDDGGGGGDKKVHSLEKEPLRHRKEFGNMLGIDTDSLSELLNKLGLEMQLGDFLSTSSSPPPPSQSNPTPSKKPTKKTHTLLPAKIATGVGAVIPPDMPYLRPQPSPSSTPSLKLTTHNPPPFDNHDHHHHQLLLPFTTFYFGSEACASILPKAAAAAQVLVLKRGGCTFSEKLQNVPDTWKRGGYIRIVVIVDYPPPPPSHNPTSSSSSSSSPHNPTDSPSSSPPDSNHHRQKEKHHSSPEAVAAGDNLITPHLDTPQYTYFGKIRKNPVPLVIVSGGEEVYELLRKRIRGLGVRRRLSVRVQETGVGNLVVV